jgi:nicotinate-nucleotide pyrophosphorylase (carboxylating)
MGEPLKPLDPDRYRDLVRRALAEDIGTGDVTTEAIVPADRAASARLIAKSACVVSGLDVAREVFAQLDRAVTFTPHKLDSDRCDRGEVIAELRGPARAILAGERTALNFLQHLSGIATLTRAFVDAAGGHLTILDTRKTIPLLRELAKYAVRCGGGANHRMGLYDAVLIKDNHIAVAGGVIEAVRCARRHAPGMIVEVEAQSLDDVDRAVEAGAEVIMLDNLDADAMRGAIRRIGGRARTEISGGVTLADMSRLREIGADCISIGALTHSAPAADLSLDVRLDG